MRFERNKNVLVKPLSSTASVERISKFCRENNMMSSLKKKKKREKMLIDGVNGIRKMCGNRYRRNRILKYGV